MTDEKTPSATPEWHDQDNGADAAADRTYNPSTQQVNRSREQGLGVGQTEINAQRDPTRYDSGDHFGAGEGGPQDLSPEGGGVSTPKSAFSDSGDSLDDSRDQIEGGEQS